jgi:hypothetical protein
MGSLRKIPKNTRVLDEDGPPCPRCSVFTEIREHIKIRDKELKRPFYYSKWFNCVNKDCKTNLIMPDEFRIFKSNRNRKFFENKVFHRNRDKCLDKGINTTNGSRPSLRQGSYSPPWLTDKEYESELQLEKIKEQLKPRE